MTTAAIPVSTEAQNAAALRDAQAQGKWRQILGSRRVVVGGGILLSMFLLSLCTLPWTLYRTRTPQADGTVTYGDAYYTLQKDPKAWEAPTVFAEEGWSIQTVEGWFGYDKLGRSVLARCLFGGMISLAVGLAAATISVVLGVAVGLIAGYRGGWVDSALMRMVDVLYGLPYILLVILFKVAFEAPLTEGVKTRTFWGMIVAIAVVATWIAAGTARRPQWKRGLRVVAGVMLVLVAALWWPNPSAKTVAASVPATAPATTTSAVSKPAQAGDPPGIAFKLSAQSANLVVLFSAIGLVSWLTMARVVRGQVLSLRGQPFIEACRAMGLKEGRIFLRHILPNLVGPITVYATLTVPSAILQESFLSFLGVGVNAPLATWGSLASEGVEQLSPLKFYWWLLVFPCTLLAMTLLSLNFLGDGLRDVFDPKKEAAKI